MGKRAEQAKKRKRNSGKPAPAAAAARALPTPPNDSRSASPPAAADGDDLILQDELDATVFTLTTLAANPALLAGRNMKDLKRAVYDIHRVMSEAATVGASVTSRISAALRDYRFTDALVLLFEMYTRRIPAKLGALQRWVRECDATSGADGSPGDAEAMRCLDMILRIAGGHAPAVDDVHVGHSVSGEAESSAHAHVRKTRVWRARDPSPTMEIAIWEQMTAGTLLENARTGYLPTESLSPGAIKASAEAAAAAKASGGGSYPGFRAVQHTPAALRRPPNMYPSTVYTSTPGAIALTASGERPAPSRIDVPGVPGAFVVLDVFTPEECLQIVQAASAIGFERDQAAAGSATEKRSILARNFVWLADSQFHDHFYNRIKDFVPPTAPSGGANGGEGKVRGINKRFRVYQYTENQLYRPHIDGAWPAAGIDAETGEYLHDSQPADDPLWSRYTLLVYLNSDIPEDTGCTTFFLPSREMGVMDATSVRPVQGAVLCFPHGDTAGSLLHEGSAVGADGGKLVIRTDLLYEAQGFGAFKPAAAAAAAAGDQRD